MNEEDKTLFQQAMQDVKPLANKKTIPMNKLTPTVPAIPHRPLPILAKNIPLSDSFYQPVTAETMLSYHTHHLPKKRLRQLQQGQIPYTARLDLHGMSPEQACRALCYFIDTQHDSQQRCLLIIHGKGGRHHEAPVIKNLVNHWLKQLPQVLAFHSALPKDGGNGALYVLLKRFLSNTIEFHTKKV